MQQEHSKYNKNDKEVWGILFKRQHNNLKDIFEEQKTLANRMFSDFYIKNYLTWLNNKKNTPTLSNNVLNKFVRSKLNDNDK